MDLVFDPVENDAGKDFHRKRVAFLIYDEKIYFLRNSVMTHWQWQQTLGLNLSKDEFNTIVRGYYINGEAVFYKGNFTYDDDCIETAKKYIQQIKDYCEIGEVDVWCGEIIGEVGSGWDHDLYLGKF